MDEIKPRCFNLSGSRIRALGCKNGLELAVYRDNSNENVFINIHGCPLPPEDCTEVIIIIDEEPRSYKAQQFLGGQRYLIEESGGNAIIEALYNGKTVTVKIGPYCKEYPSDNFPSLYK